MKIKPTSTPGKVTVELSHQDDQLIEQSIKDAEAEGWPFQLRTILVSVDFSDFSKRALAYAIPLAEKFGARIVFVHVEQPVIYADTLLVAAEAEEMSLHAGQESKRLLESLAREQESPIAFETMVRVGRPYEEIVDAAKTVDADLIVIATHGHTGLKHVLLGSTTERVVRHAHCPVLVVRERAANIKQSTDDAV